MEQAPGLVTIYRSMDQTAKDDCETYFGMLMEEGLAPAILDDTQPGVPEGVYELRVPPEQVSRAEEVIAANPLPGEVEEVDPAHELDTETIYHSEGNPTAEMQAVGIKNVLEDSGISAMIVGDSVLPNFPFEVRVAREQADRAREVIAEAQRSGPAAADEAELQSERAPAE